MHPKGRDAEREVAAKVGAGLSATRQSDRDGPVELVVDSVALELAQPSTIGKRIGGGANSRGVSAAYGECRRSQTMDAPRLAPRPPRRRIAVDCVEWKVTSRSPPLWFGSGSNLSAVL
jgi:hypothetical protein